LFGKGDSLKTAARLAILTAAVIVLAASALLSGGGEAISFYAIPYDAFRSLIRMTAAYIISILFSLIYAYAMYASRAAERIMHPILDVLQSVPILGFFPVALYFFVDIVSGSEIGWEFASIFLIFTSMVWNITFGMYDSLISIPGELNDATKIYGLTGWRRFRDLFFPSMIPKLIYNSMVSWAGGWYFLIPAEYITTSISSSSGGAVLPGLGSILYLSALKGEVGLMAATFAVLVIIIVAMDLFIWRPLSAWSEKYKYEYTLTDGGGTVYTKFPMRQYYEWFPLLPGSGRRISKAVGRAAEKFNDAGHRISRFLGRTVRYWKIALLSAVAVLFALFVFAAFGAIETVYALITGTGKEYAVLMPEALGLSLLRLVAAYFISLAIAIPLAVAATRKGRGSHLMMGSEIVASVPATAIFPIIVFLLIDVTHGLNIPSILLLVTGMIWYIFFNVSAGLKSIPSEIMEAARNYGVKGRLYIKRVMLPAIFPSLVTGSITAFGGGWNALIVSEYVPSITPGASPYYVLGIGYLIDKATYTVPENTGLLVFSLIVMICAVIAINRLFWRRLQKLAEKRYKMEGIS
jgi:NitT/TauT family transport system permease protein